jgi:radical SAM superfamily enzyme YgiQ (UPF0313 family)
MGASKKVVGISFPRNNPNLGLEPSILSVLPPGENVEYVDDNRSFVDHDIGMYLCSVYINGVNEFKEWAMKHDTRKIVVGGYHPTMFPEDFLNFANKIVVGPCDDLDATLSQKGVLFEKSHYDGLQIGNARFVEDRILKRFSSVEGWTRIHGEMSSNQEFPEEPSGKADVLEDRVLPGVLTFRNSPRYDLYDIRKNQQIIPDKKIDDLSTSINTSMGCPYKCDFCCTPVMFGKNLISKPLEIIERDAQIVAAHFDKADEGNKERFLFFRDENLLLQPDYKDKLEIIADKTNAKVYLFASANMVTEEAAKTMAENNVYMVCLGLEDPTKSYGKNKRLNQSVEILKDHGIATYLSFIVDPLQMVGEGKAKEFYNLLYQKFEELKPEMVCGNFLMPFPGTPIWDKYYHLISNEDFEQYDSKTPFLIKNEIVAEKMKYYMFDVQWKYYNSDLYNNEVRQFDVGDTLNLRFTELKEQFDKSLGILHLRP